MASNIIELIAELQEIVDAGYGHLPPATEYRDGFTFRFPVNPKPVQMELTEHDSDRSTITSWGGPEEVDCYEHATHILL